MYKADNAVHLPKLTPIDTPANQLSQSPEDLLIESTEDCLLQSLDCSQMDSEDNSLDTLLPEVPMEVEPVQLMNQLLTQLATEPSTEIHPTPFTGIATDNILGWLKFFDQIAAHSVWNDKKVIPVYLKDSSELLSLVTRPNKN